jgi:hypothetical protein
MLITVYGDGNVAHVLTVEISEDLATGQGVVDLVWAMGLLRPGDFYIVCSLDVDLPPALLVGTHIAGKEWAVDEFCCNGFWGKVWASYLASDCPVEALEIPF